MGDKITIKTGDTGQGSVVVGKVAGTGNVVGAGNTVTSSHQIAIPAQKIEALPRDLAQGMNAFLERVNALLAQSPPQDTQPVQEVKQEIEAMVDETNAAIGDDKSPEPAVPVAAKMSIGLRLVNAAKGILKLLPKTAETIAAFSPLAPFSKIIGQGVEELVGAVVQETK